MKAAFFLPVEANELSLLKIFRRRKLLKIMGRKAEKSLPKRSLLTVKVKVDTS